MKFVDFNDPSIPLGKRKVAYVKYAVSHGTPLETAKLQCARKFRVRDTAQVAPPMHYYIVWWNGGLHLRNCSEHIKSDEEVIMLIHKNHWYILENIARNEGVKNPINMTREAFQSFYDKHRETLLEYDPY